MWIWSHEEMMGWQGPRELSPHWKKATQVCCQHHPAVRTWCPLSFLRASWSPPGDWMSCVLVKSTATLPQQLHWLVCLQATWKVKDHPRCWNTTLFRWTHFGAAMVSTADGRAHLQQDSRSWGPAPTCGANSSHRTLLPSMLSRRNWGLFFFLTFLMEFIKCGL